MRLLLNPLEIADFENSEYEIKESNDRSYGNDESILVYDTKTHNSTSEMFDSLNVSYKRFEYIYVKESTGWRTKSKEQRKETEIVECFHSLQSALTDGCDYVHLGDTISFSGKPHLQKEEKVFILPLISHNETHNIIPETIYFHCISGVKDATIGILSPIEKNKVITVFCRSNVLIFHSTEEFVKVIKAIRSDKDEWEYIESKAYRYVETMKENPPFIKETNQTRIRNQIVEDVIQYNIPVVIEGVTSSGKTFTVEQYCRRSLIPFVRYNFSPSSTTEELLGDMVITNDETERIKFQDGAFTDAFIHGKLLLMDEMSLAPPSVVQRWFKVCYRICLARRFSMKARMEVKSV